MTTTTFGGFPDIMFGIIPLLAVLGFVLVLGVIIVLLIMNARRWNRNNHSPVVTVDAVVITKRTNVVHHNAGMNDLSQMSSSSTYYVTFEFGSGDRFEFAVGGPEFGMLAERDSGKLTFQGTRFLKFERWRNT